MNSFSIRIAIAVILLAAGSVTAYAQSGTLSGRVSDAETGAPLVSATVRALGVSSRQAGAITDAKGRYTIRGLAPGTYTVSVTFVGYTPFEAKAIVTEGAAITIDAELEQGALGLGDVVVSASRKQEKVTDAPASVSVVSARQIERQPALTVIDHLREVPGVDIVQSGLTQSNVVARGFNNVFSGSLMVLTDNRIASVPSLRLNAYNFIPLVNEDVQQLEVIRGPGAALYGPNTANGVLHTITRSPFSSAGTWLSLSAGERDVVHAQARHAGIAGDRFGYKISAQYMRGTDWSFVDTAEVSAVAAAQQKVNAGQTVENFERIGVRDSAIERFGGEIRLDYVPIDDLTLIGSAGINQAVRNIDITGLGAGQVQNWRYMYYQLRASYKDLFVQAFMNLSDAGETYLVRTGAPVVDRSALYVAQAQHSYSPLDMLSLTYGVDLLVTTPVTESTITGRNEDDDNTTEVGGYLQAKASLVEDLLEVVAAARADKHSRLDDVIFSPRAALVYTPATNQTLRFTYNRAYSAPTTNELFLDILGEKSLLFDVRGSGVPSSGFTFRYENGRNFMHLNSSKLGGGDVVLPYGADPRLWDLVRTVIKANPDTSEVARTLKAFADSVPAPPAEMVGVEMRVLNATTGAFEAYAPAGGRVPDRRAVQPTINQTLELGYKGVIADRIVLSVDLYRSHYTDFVGPLEVITPSVFYNREQLQNYLQLVFSQRFSADTAALYAALAAVRVAGVAGEKGDLLGIPLANITPNEAPDPNAITLSYRNYGDITLYGYDIGLQVGVTDRLSINGSLSYVDKNFFENLDGVADLSLNAPKFKFSLGADYDDPKLGFNANVRMRHVDGYPVRSGVYRGEVKGFSVIDLTLGYRLPWIEGLTASLSAQNLLTFVDGDGEDGAEPDESPFSRRHYEFVGVPALGRLMLARLTYAFK